MRPRTFSFPARTLLLLLIGGSMLATCVWWWEDYSIRGIDSTLHIANALRFHDLLADNWNTPGQAPLDRLRFWYNAFSTPSASLNTMWPQMPYWLSALFLELHRSHFAIRLPMLLYFVILILSCYSLAAKLQDRATGVLAAFFVSTTPLIFMASRHYALDFPMTAMALATWCCLIKSDHFSQRGWSFIAGLALGLGMHCKGQILFFVTPIILVELARGLGSRTTGRWFRAPPRLNILLFLGAAFILAAPWWLRALPDIAQQFREHVGSTEHLFFSQAKTDAPYSPLSMSWYLFFLWWHNGLGPVYALALLPSLWFLRRRTVPYLSTLFITILGNLALFSIVLVLKQARYILPLAPLVGIVLALGLRAPLGKGWSGRTVLALLILFGFAHYFFLSWHPDSYLYYLHGRRTYQYSNIYMSPPQPDTHRWRTPLAQELRRLAGSSPKVKVLLVGMDQSAHPPPLDAYIDYWLRLADADIEVDHLFFNTHKVNELVSHAEFVLVHLQELELSVLDSSAILTHLRGYLYPWSWDYLFPNPNLESFLLHFNDLFVFYSQYRTPDGHTISVFVRRRATDDRGELRSPSLPSP